MRIGFWIDECESWPGGRIYLRGLIRALRDAYGEKVGLCLLVSGGPRCLSDESGVVVDEAVEWPTFRRGSIVGRLHRRTKRLFRHDVVKDLFLRRRGVEVIAFGEPPWASRIPTLGWLPDFQHLRLPEMFGPQEREERDQWYRGTLERATRILLMSESVRRDCEAFAPQYAHKARVVAPVSYVPAAVYEADPTSVSEAYGLPEKFVYLPNQFWKHKNHMTAFFALRILREKGIKVFMASSGLQEDYRHPTYFDELCQELGRSGTKDQVAFLGLIPREHVFALMRQSVCVLSPSLFEGYGMTVDEARSVGKQVLASDIAAHREQELPRAMFFGARDAQDLAEKLEEVWREKSPGPDKEYEAEARDTLPERRRRYAEAFLAVVQEVVA